MLHVQVDKKWADKNCKKEGNRGWWVCSVLSLQYHLRHRVTAAAADIAPKSSSRRQCHCGGLVGLARRVWMGSRLSLQGTACGSYTQAGVMCQFCPMAGSSGGLAKGGGGDLQGLKLEEPRVTGVGVVGVVLAAIILVVAAVSGCSGDLYARWSYVLQWLGVGAGGAFAWRGGDGGLACDEGGRRGP
ncbi:hypothetical protein EDB83DRAFT_2313891 [Lactarius deliciosus]|nr:hypothetical protein EDB83DRAFT_2313891 [Lactarius deliciosus]